MVTSLLAVAVHEGADFDAANAFVNWAREHYTDAELEARSLPELWFRFLDRDSWNAQMDKASDDANRWAKATARPARHSRKR